MVAVWQEWENEESHERLDIRGQLYVLPPCGHCRQFMLDVDPTNRDTEVILSPGESLLLRELLPRNAWPDEPTPLPS